MDRTRSAFYLPNTRNFPKNTEVDFTLTFVNENAGGGGGDGGPVQGPPAIGQAGGGGGFGGLFSGSVASVTPSADSVTMREHVSLVELPDGNFRPPRRSARRVRRHELRRLQPANQREDSHSVHPAASPAEKRSVGGRQRAGEADRYWVDSGAPDDVKRALVEGASWWNQAFEAAGFRSAFKVAVLPDGADPMDIRYNMINWVHRSTRGWSSGSDDRGIRGPVRSSRPPSRWGRCAIGRTT